MYREFVRPLNFLKYIGEKFLDTPLLEVWQQDESGAEIQLAECEVESDNELITTAICLRLLVSIRFTPVLYGRF